MEKSIVLSGKVKLMPYGENYNGKHDGWAFQFLNDNYQGFYKGVCCKDYLLDQVWSDLTQKVMRIYGQQSSYKGIIDKQISLKLAMYPYYFHNQREPIIEELEQLMFNLQKFINDIELLMNIDELSKFECIDNKIIIEFSKKWIEKPYLLSLYTLFCRLGIYYDGNLEEYIKNPYKTNGKYLDNCDNYYLKNSSNKILDIIYNKAIVLQKDWKDLIGGNEVHDSGIFSNMYNLKYVENDINKKEN